MFQSDFDVPFTVKAGQIGEFRLVAVLQSHMCVVVYMFVCPSTQLCLTVTGANFVSSAWRCCHIMLKCAEWELVFISAPVPPAGRTAACLSFTPSSLVSREADAEDPLEEPVQRRCGGHAGRTVPAAGSWSQ